MRGTMDGWTCIAQPRKRSGSSDACDGSRDRCADYPRWSRTIGTAWCLEEIQQINAVTAAAREVALLVVADHLRAGVDFAVEANDGEMAIREMITVLRAALRQ